MSVYVSTVGAISDENVRQIAKALPYIDSGVSRDVYDLGDVVLKVDRGNNYAGNCASEVLAWEEFEGTSNEHLVTRVLASGRGWLIAEKAPTDRHRYSEQETADVIKQLEWLGIGDLHPGNIGFRISDGSPCAIDYAFNGHRGGCQSNAFSEASDSYCECGDHECQRCYPEGCECCCSLHNWEGCAEFEGCNAEECDECFAPAEIHTHERCTLFGFEYGVCTPPARGQGAAGIVRPPNTLHFCAIHAPRATNPETLQIPGQRGLWIDVWANELCLPFE